MALIADERLMAQEALPPRGVKVSPTTAQPIQATVMVVDRESTEQQNSYPYFE